MNRRDFSRRALSALLFLSASGTSLFLAGCNVFSDILNWIPVGEAALNSIISILTSNGVAISPQIQAIVQLIEAGYTALEAAVKEYQSTTPAPVGALAKVETALKDIVDNFSTFLSSLGVSGGLLGMISALAQVVLSTIAAFINRLPASMANKATHDKLAKVQIAGSPIIVTAKQRSVGEFRKDFNAQLDQGKISGITVPTGAYLR